MTTNMAAITVTDAKLISACQRSDGREKLAYFLNWESFDEDDNPRKAIQLDYLYDALMYTIQKGLPWNQVCSCFEATQNILQDTLGKPITAAVKIIKQHTDKLANHVSGPNIKVYTEYMFSTFMTHYRLYQYVFLEDLTEEIRQVHLHVETPVEPYPFKEGKTVNIWEYEEKLRDIERKEEQKRQEREREKTELNTSHAKQKEEVYNKIKQDEAPVDRDHILQIIGEVASAHLTAASDSIKHNIACTSDDLEFKLQKTSLPRPQELGAPPRFKPKTPVGTRQSKPKSAKREKSSRTKSRASVKSGRKA